MGSSCLSETDVVVKVTETGNDTQLNDVFCSP